MFFQVFECPITPAPLNEPTEFWFLGEFEAADAESAIHEAVFANPMDGPNAGTRWVAIPR